MAWSTTPVRNTTDHSNLPPRLRCYLNLGTLGDLPATTRAPRLQGEALLAAIKEAGYEGVQGGEVALCRKLGIPNSTGGRINRVGEADPFAKAAKEAGHDFATLHVAWGLESDHEMDALVDDVLEASARHDFPLYIETHRATLTQDIWRTVQLVGRRPGIRINGDFSHWYTGHEMVYGDLNAKLDFCSSVFERVRYMHGRIGNPGHMQVHIGDGGGRTYVEHFKNIWTRCMAGFLRTALWGDYLVFAPELLPAGIYYAMQFTDSQRGLIEEGDRWEQALVLCRIARQCFADAQAAVPPAQAKAYAAPAAAIA